MGRFAFYRMVPRHTDSYSLCYSGRQLDELGAAAHAAGQKDEQATAVKFSARPVELLVGGPRPMRCGALLVRPLAALLMCRFAAPLAFNFMAAIAMPEARGQQHTPVSVHGSRRQPSGFIG